MPRLLAFSLEPSDALQALLRLKAAVEAGRWPRELSMRFAQSIEHEFGRMEECVRVIGVCYADLEERRVAEINRAPQSRFADVDGALHLGSCAIDVSLDLEYIRVAVERGDHLAKESARSLATSLRSLLWYAVNTELLVCSRLVMGTGDAPPDRALRFVDGFLAAAWRPGAPPDPPLPSLAPRYEERAPVSFAAEHADGESLRGGESTAVFVPPGAIDFDGLTHPGLIPRVPLDALHALPETDHTMPAVFGLATTQSMEPVTWEASNMTTVQMNAREILSEDARFFLNQSGAPWPCDATRLNAAHAVVSARPPIAEDGSPLKAEAARAWNERIHRGFVELKRLVPR